MTAPVTDVRAHVDYFLTVLEDVHPYRFGEVPGADGRSGVLPDRYAMVDVQRTYVRPTTLDAVPVMSGWVVTVRGVGKSMNEAAWVLSKATGVLEAARVTVAGYQSTPLEFDSDAPIRRDDERHWGDVAFTYFL